MPTQFGLGQAGQNAPWWWKRLESALTYLSASLIIMVATTTFLGTKKDLVLAGLGLLMILIKSIGIGMGEPPEPPSNPLKQQQ